MERKAPGGIEVLTYIYAVNLCFYLLSLVLFYNNILIAGHGADGILSNLTRFILIAIPVYLFFRLRRLKVDAWFLAVYFHLFFLLNSCLLFLENMGFTHAFIRIVGIYSPSGYSPAQVFALALGTQLNLVIFIYLLKVRRFFF
jgi:hypothetical protein